MVFESDEKKSLQNLVKSCLLEINSLKMDLASVEMQKVNLENEKIQFHHDEAVSQLQDNLSNKENELLKLKTNFQAEINDLHASINAKNEEINVKNKIILDNEQVISHQDFKIRKLTDFDNNIKSVRTSLQEDITYIRSSLQKLLNNFEIEDNISDDKSIVKSKIIDEKDYEIKELSQNLEESKIKIIKLQNQLASKDSFIELKGELANTKQELSQKTEALNSLNQNSVSKDDYNQLLQQLQDLRELIKTKDLTIQDLNEYKTKFDNLEKEFDDFKQNTTMYNENYNNPQNEIEGSLSDYVTVTEYDKLRKENILKDEKIYRLEKINDLLSELEDNQKNNNPSNADLENQRLKQEIQQKDEDIKKLEEIQDLYNKLIIPPKDDLTSFQSQVFNLIPDEPLNSNEIYKYIQNVAFDKVSFESIENILKKLVRKGYLTSSNVNDEIVYTKVHDNDSYYKE